MPTEQPDFRMRRDEIVHIERGPFIESSSIVFAEP